MREQSNLAVNSTSFKTGSYFVMTTRGDHHHLQTELNLLEILLLPTVHLDTGYVNLFSKVNNHSLVERHSKLNTTFQAMRNIRIAPHYEGHM